MTQFRGRSGTRDLKPEVLKRKLELKVRSGSPEDIVQQKIYGNGRRHVKTLNQTLTTEV